MVDTQNLSQVKDAIIDAVLKTLRDQRDTKQLQDLSDTYDFNPQIFQSGVHYIAGPIAFKTPFQTTPSITFGAVAQKVVQDTTVIDKPTATGYIPTIVYPYVYGFSQSAGLIGAFYIGLYALTSIPANITTYTICWHARGKGSAYSQQRIDEAWTSSYNKNAAPHLLNDTGQDDSQT